MSFTDAIVHPPPPKSPSMNPFNAAEEEQSDSPRQQIKREMRQLEANKRLPFPIHPAGMDEFKRRSLIEEEERRKIQMRNRQRKRELIRRTLSEDYPGLDYLGFHNVLNARFTWYRLLWFSLVTVCLLVGLFTIYRIIREYAENPTATSINVKSVEKLLLPQLTLCPTHGATVNLDKLEEKMFANNPRVEASYTREDVMNFAYFMVAGSGFQKMDPKRINPEERQRMQHFYNIFRDGQSIQEFFNYFFNNFGLDCRQFFQSCQLGDNELDCCRVFEPAYLMRRGRCFRSVPLYQHNFDELGKLRVQLMHPNEMDANMTTKEQIIAFIAEYKPQIAPFPRYYLYSKIWTKMRLTAKRIRLFPTENACSVDGKKGKDICYTEKWLQTFLEGPHNCTYPYMDTIRQTGLTSCEPLLLLENYMNLVETVNYTMNSPNQCLPCDRWEYTVSMEKIDTTTVYNNASLPFVYRVDLSYNDLQFDLIEEVITLTFAGLISQIGGQMSLFMGSSILTLIQALIMAIIISHRMMRDKQRRQSAVGNGQPGEGEEKRKNEEDEDEGRGRGEGLEHDQWKGQNGRGEGWTREGQIPMAKMDLMAHRPIENHWARLGSQVGGGGGGGGRREEPKRIGL